MLSGFNPVQTLYGRLRLGGTPLGGRNYLGKSLVVLQFAIAVFLLIGTAVLHGQFQFIHTANVGAGHQIGLELRAVGYVVVRSYSLGMWTRGC